MTSRNYNFCLESAQKINKSKTIDRKKYIKIRSINNTKFKKTAFYQLIQKKLNQTRLDIFRFFISKYFYYIYIINIIYKIDYAKFYYIKSHIIKKIIEEREQKAKIIQKYYKISLVRRDLFALAKKHLNYYSVFPSKTNFKKISIKLYTNLKDPNKYAILPVRHCPIRNYYIFDIPKKKFPSKKKLMYFSFIIDEYKIVDPSYGYKTFGQEYINFVDFNIIEKRQQKLLKKYSEISNNTIWINGVTPYGEIGESNENSSYSHISNVFNFENRNLSSSLNHSMSKFTKNFNKNNNYNEHDNLINTTNESSMNFDCLSISVNENCFRNNRMKRNKSILKEHKRDLSLSSSSSKKIVSFGNVQFSY